MEALAHVGWRAALAQLGPLEAWVLVGFLGLKAHQAALVQLDVMGAPDPVGIQERLAALVRVGWQAVLAQLGLLEAWVLVGIQGLKAHQAALVQLDAMEASDPVGIQAPLVQAGLPGRRVTWA